MALAMLVIGAVGVITAKSEEADIEQIFKYQVVPMREVARIRRLVVDNAGHMFRTFQHNPNVEYAKLHDHPVSEHLKVIDKNLKWMDETFVSLKSHLAPGSKELKLLQEIESEYRPYANGALKPAMERLLTGNYALDRWALS